MLKTYIYPAIVSYEEDGICINFIDFDEAYTDGQTEEEMLINAVEVLKLTINGRIEDKEEIPKPSAIKDLELKENERLIYVTAEVDDKIKLIKKTLNIPENLNEMAKYYNINFSNVLTKALEKEIEFHRSL